MKEQLQLKSNNNNQKKTFGIRETWVRTCAVWNAALSSETSCHVYSSAHLNLPLNSQQPGTF